MVNEETVAIAKFANKIFKRAKKGFVSEDDILDELKKYNIIKKKQQCKPEQLSMKLDKQ